MRAIMSRDSQARRVPSWDNSCSFGRFYWDFRGFMSAIEVSFPRREKGIILSSFLLDKYSSGFVTLAGFGKCVLIYALLC